MFFFLAVVVGAALVLNQILTNSDCSPCDCSDDKLHGCPLFERATTLRFHHTEKTIVPRYLDLTSLGIKSIARGAFKGLRGLDAPVKLHLFDNKLTKINQGTFDGLGSLEELDLWDNKITKISSGAFDGLGSLETLHLDLNSITNIEPGTFSDLRSLKLLNLNNNADISFDQGAFDGLDNLEELWLEGGNVRGCAFAYDAGLKCDVDCYDDFDDGVVCQAPSNADA